MRPVWTRRSTLIRAGPNRQGQLDRIQRCTHAAVLSNVPPIFVVPDKLHQSPKANLSCKGLRPLNAEPEIEISDDHVVTPNAHLLTLSQLIMDLNT